MSRGTVNKAILVGRLGKDPEMRYAPSGTAIATFSIATNHRQKVENEWVDKTEWHNIITFGKLAEFAGEYLQKGKLVYIEGRLQTNSWEDQQGVKKYKTEIVANELQLIGSKSDGDSSAASDAASPDEASHAQVADEGEDDLPF
jgi:single-strand DNA-binding protein